MEARSPGYPSRQLNRRAGLDVGGCDSRPAHWGGNIPCRKPDHKKPRAMPRGNEKFNDTYLTSRYKAYDPEGKYREIVSLTNEAKRRYEARGWTFTRTRLREGDRIATDYQ